MTGIDGPSDAYLLRGPPEYPEATGVQEIYIERGPESLPPELAAMVPFSTEAELTVEVEVDACGIDYGEATAIRVLRADATGYSTHALKPPVRVALTDREWQEAIDRRLEAMADAEEAAYDQHCDQLREMRESGDW